MKLVLEIESIAEARVAATILQRAFPEAWAPRPQEEAEVQVPAAPVIVAPDGAPAATTAEEKPAKVREKRTSKQPEKAETAPAPAAAPAATAPAAPTIRLEDVRAAAREVRQADGTPNLTRVREILTQFGATRIDGLKQEQYAPFIAACNEKPAATQASLDL